MTGGGEKLLSLGTAIALGLALAACGEAGDSDRQTAGQKLADEFSRSAKAAPARALAPGAFADAIAADDAYELESARLARAMGRSREVRAFAAQMIQDHSVAGAELRNAAALARDVTISAAMTSDERKDLDDLRHAGDDFDKVYARQQIAAHERALTALRDYAENGGDPALSEFAADAENMAADHLRVARKLS